MIEAQCYVDKTEYIQKIIETGGNQIITRPRRFGKSILLRTIEEICDCNKKLFKNYHIGKSQTYKWEKYPVLKFNFSSMINLDSKTTHDNLKDVLRNVSKKYNVLIDENATSTTMFRRLIKYINVNYKGTLVKSWF